MAAAEIREHLSILYVDDHAGTCRVVSRLLTLLGYRVTTANSIRMALGVAQKESFNLLISDIGLCDGSGSSLLRELLAVRPITGIALSGYSDDAAIQRSLEDGFTEHLIKPVTLEQLSAAIERASEKVQVQVERKA